MEEPKAVKQPSELTTVIEPVELHTAQLPATNIRSTGVRRSARVRTQQKEPYIPSMSGKTYSKAANFLQALVVGELPKDLEISFLNKMFEEHPHESATILIQLSMKAGLKAWGNVVKDATCDEMKQLHLCETFRPKKWKQLTRKQRAEVLELHLFLKRKRCGKIKGRTVAGGNK